LCNNQGKDIRQSRIRNKVSNQHPAQLCLSIRVLYHRYHLLFCDFDKGSKSLVPENALGAKSHWLRKTHYFARGAGCLCLERGARRVRIQSNTILTILLCREIERFSSAPTAEPSLNGGSKAVDRYIL